MRKRIISALLVVLILLSSFIMTSAATVELQDTGATVELAETGSELYGLCDNVQYGQILQCWNWSFNNIKALLPKIAAQGFTAIQTSPIQSSKESTKEYYSTVMNSSWVFYQPINFKIETNSYSALGTKTEFKAMCEEAHKYGIKVIVDAVLNHTANDMSENTIHPYVPSEIKDNSDCWNEVSKTIYNFDDRYECTHYSLSGLPDLNTANSIVQKHATNFLKECIAAGADGFRFDAAKHIETPSDASGVKSDFWPNVLGAATEYAQESRGITPFYYGEILGTPGGGLGIDAYTQYMSVTDTGANDIRQAVIDGNASRAASSGISCGASPNKAVQWTESHDTFKDNGTRFVSDHNINKTWAIVGARNQVCGMYLARPENIDTTMLGDADVTSWANPEVKAVNKFKNYFAGQSEYMASSGGVAYIERGTSGVVLVNTGGTYYNNVSVTAHQMKSGTYKDVITGNEFTVSDGKISGDIGDTGIAVVYDIDSSGYLDKGSVTDFRLVGTFNDWDTDANVMVAKDTNVATTSIILDAGTYSFKVKGGDLWFSNTGTITDTTGSGGWTMNPGVDDNCTFVASKSGKFTFSFNSVTQKLVVEYSEDVSSGVYLKGTFNNWDTSAPMNYESGTNTVSATLEIPAGTYTFKVHNSDIDAWYGNVGTINNSTGETPWTMSVDVSEKCTLNAVGGTYTFSFNLSKNKLSVATDTVATTAAATTVAETTVAETTVTEAVETTVSVVDPDISPYYVKGSFNNWGESDPLLFTDDNDILSATIELSEGTHTFKLYKSDTDKWYSNTGTINDTTGETGWTMKDTVSDKCTINASGGYYTFSLARSTKKLTVLYTPYEQEETTIAETTVAETTVAETTVAETTVTEAVETTVSVVDPDISPYYVKGSFNNWGESDPLLFTDDNDILSATIELSEGTHTFKLYKSDTGMWYSNTGTINDTTGETGWTMKDTVSDNCTINASGGYYTFSLARSTKKLTVLYTPYEQEETTIAETTIAETTVVEIPEEFTVKFVDYDGTVLSEQKVAKGDAAIAPDSPTRGGYNFKGWDVAFDNIVSDTTVTAQYTKIVVPSTTGTLKIDVTGGSGFKISVNGGALRPQGPSYKNTKTPIGATVTIEANTSAGAIFMGWVDAAGAVVSTGETFTFTTSGNDYFKAMYQTVVEGVNLVVFKNDRASGGNGQILDMQYYTYGDDIVTPDNPSLAGYDFAGWNMTDAEIQAELKAGRDVTVIANWTRAVKLVTITVEGGTYNGAAEGQHQAYTAATVVANAPVDGMKFAYWTNAQGKVVSYDSEYKFYPADDTALKANYVAESAEIEYEAIVSLGADPTTTGEKITYTLSWDVPESVGEFKLAGLMVVDAEDYNPDTFYHGSGDSKLFDRALSGSMLIPKNSYGITKSASYYGHTYYACTWVQYVDANGETVTVHSDMVEIEKLAE